MKRNQWYRCILVLFAISTLSACAGGGSSSSKQAQLSPEQYLQCSITVETLSPNSANVSLKITNNGPDGLEIFQPTTATITWVLSEGRKIMDVATSSPRKVMLKPAETLVFRDSMLWSFRASIEHAEVRTGATPPHLLCYQ